VRWVLKHVRPRVDLARGVIRFYERDVEAWMESNAQEVVG
jgi:predicted DNA-binding transcriptional regulator AlpA